MVAGPDRAEPRRRLARAAGALIALLAVACEGRGAHDVDGGKGAEANPGRGTDPPPNLEPDAGRPPPVDAAPADATSPALPPAADAAPDGRPEAPRDTGPPPPDAAVPPDAAPRPDAPWPDVAVPPDAPPACTGPGDCARGANCAAGRCLPAPVSCRAFKADHPAAGDGVYWINPSGVPLRAYCDMRERIELCTELEAEHRGVTRDPARLVFTMMSVLDAGEGTCRLWALRASDGYPIDTFVRSDPAQARDTCALLGFVSTASLTQCSYGSDAAQGYSKCGFPIGTYMRWGTSCSGCQQNDGEHDRYVLQGPMIRGQILGTFDGSRFLRCKVR